jgi:hypothetical protein
MKTSRKSARQRVCVSENIRGQIIISRQMAVMAPSSQSTFGSLLGYFGQCHACFHDWRLLSVWLSRSEYADRQSLTRLGIRAKRHFALHQRLPLPESGTEQVEHYLALRRQQPSIADIQWFRITATRAQHGRCRSEFNNGRPSALANF